MDEKVFQMVDYQDAPSNEVKEFKLDKEVAERIKELDAEIEEYRARIMDAEGALDSAEKELAEVFSGLNV